MGKDGNLGDFKEFDKISPSLYFQWNTQSEDSMQLPDVGADKRSNERTDIG